jgi:hypothetical protein
VNIKDRLNKVKIDQFGNIYEISAFEVSPGHYPRYILRKNDAYGNLIWEKRASINYFLSGDVFGVVIEDIDFDEEGNPIIGLWIHSSIAYQDELINYSQQISYLQGNCYILKLDKNSGDVIWNASLYNLAPGALFSTGVRITDIVVDGNFVHASTYSNYNLDFFTLNIENGSLINTTPFLLEGSPNLEFIVPGFLFPFGTLGSSTQSYWSPQIDVLSTGEVVAVGNYQTCNSQNYPQLNIYGGGMFILKYHPDFGIYDVNKMAQTGYFEGASGIINAGFYETPRMFVDKNDNISVAGFWENNYWNDTPIEIKVFDSVLPMKSGSFIVNFDKDYNMNWLSIGTHAKIEDLAYIPSTNETYLAVKSRDNYSIGIGNSHIRFGEEKMIEMNYTHLPDWQYEWLNNPQEQGFIVKLNENGEPLEMKEINHNSNDSISQAVRMYIRIAGTACGDLAIYTDNANISLLEVDNHEFITDSILLILQYSNCVSDDCSYFDAENEIEICSVNGTIDIQLYDYFNLNSITYSIISGGIPLVTNQTSQVVNGQFSFQAPITSGDFDIVFSSPNNDTMTVSVQSMTLNFGSITEDTLCEYGTAIILGDNAIPSNGTYTGNGVSGLFFNPSDAGVGSSLVTYQAVDSNGCSSSIDHLFVVDACLGFEEIKSNLFNVNPNPFETELIVEITNLDQLTQIEVRDQLGRIVFSQQITELTTLVNLQNLANGNYIVEIECDNKVQLRKMILKN